MFISSEQAASRLNSSENLVNRVEHNEGSFRIVTLKKGGRDEGTHILTEDTRAEIGARAHLESATELAAEYGISRQHVQNLKFGRVGARAGHEKAHPTLKQKVRQRLDEVRDVALDKLAVSLGLISEDNLSECDAKDLASISASLSKVVDATIPKDEGNKNQIQIVVCTPPTKELEHFNVVEI